MSGKEIQRLLKQREKMQIAIDKQSERIEALKAPTYDKMLSRIVSQLQFFIKLGKYADDQTNVRGMLYNGCPINDRIMKEGLETRERRMQLMVQDICIGTNKKEEKL